MNPFEIRRSEGRYDVATARELFAKFGVVLLKQFLPAHTQETLRAILEDELRGAAARGSVLKLDQYPKADFPFGDILSLRGLDRFNHIFFDREVIELAMALLDTGELVYWGDSNMQFGEAARGFHKDNVDRLNPDGLDWQGSYDLIRCAFYLQDHSKHSGGLKIRLASHNIPNHLQGKICDIASEYGDLLLWNMRLTHSGNTRKLRLPFDVPLHPRLEQIVPLSLCRPEALRRIGTFCSIGKAGPQLDRYIARMNEREKDYKPYLQHARRESEAAELARRYGVSLRLPAPYYGQLDVG